MTTQRPDPATTTGLDDGGATSPGDTPPAASSESSSSNASGERPNQAPTGGGNVPAIVALAFIALVTMAVVGYGIAEIMAYLSD